MKIVASFCGIGFVTTVSKVKRMKKTLKIVAVLAVLTGIGFLVVRKSKKRRQLKRVADNGYETAHDVLYPGKHVKQHKKLHYGPVLPHSK
jgi:hypothetical protein